MNNQIQETIDLVLTYVRMTWRHRWWALAAACLLCAVGWTYVLMLPNSFQVQTKVFLDTRTLLTPVLKGIAMQTNLQSNAAFMMRRTLLIRPNLESIIRKTDMDLQAKTPQQFDQLVTGLQNNIRIGGTERTNIYRIAYANEDPKLALKVVEALLNIFVEKSLGDTRKDTSNTKQFIESQIKEYESRLLAAENRLKEFKRKNREFLSGLSGYFSNLTKSKGQLRNAQLLREEAMRRRDALKSQIAGEEPTFGLGRSTQRAAEATAVDQRINALEQQLDGLLVQYTEIHPDVQATKRLLDGLYEEREKELAVLKESQGTVDESVANQNPIYQSIKVSMAQAEAEVAALDSRVIEFQKRVVNLEKLVDTVPQIEAEFAQLNRDYKVDRGKYDAFVQRRESLKISQDASESGGNVEFNILEPPRLPNKPTSPDRQVLYAGVLGGAIAVGGALAFLLGLMRPAFFTRESVTRYAQVPVLGSVSRIWTPKERFRRRLEVVAFGLGCIGLLAVFVGVEVMTALSIDISGKFTSLVGRIS